MRQDQPGLEPCLLQATRRNQIYNYKGNIDESMRLRFYHNDPNTADTRTLTEHFSANHLLDPTIIRKI